MNSEQQSKQTKERKTVMFRRECIARLEREVALRYPDPTKRCTISNLVDEIVASHYGILHD